MRTDQKATDSGRRTFFIFRFSEASDIHRRKGSKYGKIQIATNGSIIPSDDLLDVIKKYNIEIRISNYGVTGSTSAKLRRLCEDRQLRYRYYNFADDSGEWFDCGQIDIERTEDEAVLEKRFAECLFNECLTLENGIITYCSRATNSYRLQGFERKKSDYLVVDDYEGFSEDLKKFITEPYWMEACRYCNGTSAKCKISPGTQT